MAYSLLYPFLSFEILSEQILWLNEIAQLQKDQFSSASFVLQFNNSKFREQ